MNEAINYQLKHVIQEARPARSDCIATNCAFSFAHMLNQRRYRQGDGQVWDAIFACPVYRVLYSLHDPGGLLAVRPLLCPCAFVEMFFALVFEPLDV